VSREPRALGGVIGRVLDELGHGTRNPAMKLAACWETAVGPEIAAHAEPVDWRGETLEVAVDSPSWSQQLQLRCEEILAALEEAMGPEAPTALRLRIR